MKFLIEKEHMRVYKQLLHHFKQSLVANSSYILNLLTREASTNCASVNYFMM